MTMRQPATARRWTRLVVGLLMALQLAACATGGKDVVTSSDESGIQKRARIRLELASAYFSQGQNATALDEVKQAIAADSSLGAAYNLRGLIYANMSEDKLAEGSFRQALQIDAADTSAMHNYGWFLCQRGRYDDAQSLFRQALAQPKHRDSVQTQLAQGVCLARASRLPEAELALLKTYELDPSNPATATNLADVLYRRGEFERARFYVRRVNNVSELANPETLWLAARIEQKLGNRNGVAEFGNQLRNRFPRSREAILYERGQFNE